jgi:cytochrome c-type biogenesis protein CcmH/NrfG
MLEHVVAVRKRTLAEEDHSRLTSEQVLASAYLNDRRITEAIEMLEHVMAVQKRTLAEEDYSRQVSEGWLAYALHKRSEEGIP